MQKNKEDFEEKSTFELNLLLCDMWKGFKKFWALLAAVCIVTTAIGTLLPYLRYTPVYQSQTTFAINTVRDETDTAYSFFYDSSTADQLSRLLPHVLSSDIMRQKLREELETKAIGGSITVSSVPNSNLFTLSVTGADPKEVQRVLDAAVVCLPEVCRYVIGDLQLKIIQPSELPEKPINRAFNKQQILFGFCVGGIISAACLFLYAFLRKTIRREADFREQLNMNCLGVLPQIKFKRYRKETDKTVSIFNDKTGTAFREAAGSFALKLVHRMKEKNMQVLLVTSTLPGEGKSTVAMNLALSLAEDNRKVLLIDMDLRNPSQMRLLKLSPNENADLEQVLCGKADAREALLVLDNGMQFLGNAEACRDVPKLITNAAFAGIIEQFRGETDYIIVDTPPCGAIGDAATLSEACDGICYVIRQDTAKQGQILDGIQGVAGNGTAIVGGVLNGAQNSVSGYGYGYGKYGYGYGRYGYGRYGYGSYGRDKKRDR